MNSKKYASRHHKRINHYTTAAAAMSPQGNNTKLTVFGDTIRECIIRHAGDKCRYVTFWVTIRFSNIMFVVECVVPLTAARLPFAISVMSSVVVSVTRFSYSCNLVDVISCCLHLVIVIFAHLLVIIVCSIRDLAYTLPCDCCIAWFWPWTPSRSRPVCHNIDNNHVANITATHNRNDKC